MDNIKTEKYGIKSHDDTPTLCRLFDAETNTRVRFRQVCNTRFHSHLKVPKRAGNAVGRIKTRAFFLSMLWCAAAWSWPLAQVCAKSLHACAAACACSSAPADGMKCVSIFSTRHTLFEGLKTHNMPCITHGNCYEKHGVLHAKRGPKRAGNAVCSIKKCAFFLSMVWCAAAWSWALAQVCAKSSHACAAACVCSSRWHEKSVHFFHARHTV